jgi:hypothetical protein
MGRVVRQVSEHTTRYYWYPGEKAEWVRAGTAAGLGVLTFVLVGALSGSVLAAAVSGSGMLAAVAGANLGRRETRALAAFPDLDAPGARKVAIMQTGRAVWRAMLGTGGAAAIAVLVAKLPPAGVAADWVLPLVPAAVGALAHRAGMLYERLGYASAPVVVAAGGAVAGAEPTKLPG